MAAYVNLYLYPSRTNRWLMATNIAGVVLLGVVFWW